MSPSFIFPLLLQSALLPFGVALAILLVMRKSGRPVLAAPLALLFATLASYFAVHHAQWSLVPHQALDWLPWIGLLAVAAAAGAALIRRALPRVLLRLAVGCVIALMVLAPIFANVELMQLVAVMAAAGVLVAFLWTVLGGQAQGGSTVALALVIVAGGAGLTLMIDASQSLGQLNGALAMACAACFILGFGTRRIAFEQAAIGVAVVLLAALLVNAHIYAGFSLVYLGLLVVGLAGGAAPTLFHVFGKDGSGAAVHVAAALMAGIPVLVAIGLVLQAAQESGGY